MQNSRVYGQLSSLDLSGPHVDAGMGLTSGRPESHFETSVSSSLEGRLLKTHIGGQCMKSLSAADCLGQSWTGGPANVPGIRDSVPNTQSTPALPNVTTKASIIVALNIISHVSIRLA